MGKPAKTVAFGMFPNVKRNNELFAEAAFAVQRFRIHEFAPIPQRCERFWTNFHVFYWRRLVRRTFSTSARAALTEVK